MEVSRRLVHCPLHSETQSHQREGRELEEGCVVQPVLINLGKSEQAPHVVL